MRHFTAILSALAMAAAMLGVAAPAMAEDPPETPEPDPVPAMIVVGGPAVIPEHTEQHLDMCLPTSRLAGSNRFATTRAVTTLANTNGGTVYVAQGHTFADALPAGAAANAEGGALVLVEKNSIPGESVAALDALAPDRIVIVGGRAVVSETVEAQLRTRYGTVERLAGANRYATAVEVSRSSYPSGTSAVIVASGEGFIDALAASPLAAYLGAPLLLVQGDAVPASVTAELERLAPTDVYVIGGTAVVSGSVDDALGDALPGATIRRVAGSNRFRTGEAIADLLPDTPQRLIGVTAYNFPDALAAGAVSGTSPLILLDEQGLNPVSADLVERLSGSPCEPIVKLASFTTYHDCCQSRVTNIHRIADEADDAIVEPNGIFSLNDHVGQRTLEDGYVAAGAIVGGALICCDHPANIGGGTSQFATTLYNAVFYAGLEDISHRPHSVYFSRYPLGIEATLNWTSPDVEFRNDTDWPLAIDASYTSTSIAVDVWGWADGRSVAKKVTGSATTSDGGSVKIERWVTYGDGSIGHDTWYHTYKPLQEEPDDDEDPPPDPDPDPDPPVNPPL